MKQYKTEAVILDTTDVFDADRSFLLFTRELGKVRARAKGVRKPTSKLTGHLLAYLPTALELVEGGSGLLIVQASVTGGAERSGRPYPSDPLLFMRQSEIIAEALNRLFIERDPHPVIYDGLVYVLGRLRELCEDRQSRKAVLLTAEFLLKCLAELGYRAELDRCVITEEPVTEQFVGWSSQAGGLLGETGYQQAAGAGIRLDSPRTVVLLRQFSRPEFMAERVNAAEAVENETIRVVYDYLQTQIGQPLKSL
ncbi:DNA repair protein RecO [Patescibacteria group bacterium]|nr:DNA repair protein RecO [Patescibacteria group bacterium]